jgi:hypothetical protein
MIRYFKHKGRAKGYGLSERKRRFLKYLFSLSAFSAGTLLSLKGNKGFKIGRLAPFRLTPVEANASTGTETLRPDHSDTIKIDIFTHVAPQRYADALQKISPVNTMLSNLDQRFQKMDQLGEIQQVLTLGGVLEKFTNLKFITHHSGGTVPYLAKRIELAPSRLEGLSRPIIESLRLFYNDIAVQGNTPNLMCANAFCGVDHQLFGTDFPMADIDMVKRVIRSIDEMDITDIDRRKIYADNARRLLRLTL